MNAIFNDFKITKWTHPDSEIEFTRKEYLKSSGKEGKYEDSYMLPGISPLEFDNIRIIGLTYQRLDYTKDELFEYFRLLKKQNLIKRIRFKQLEYLDEERYEIIDESLKKLLGDCWTLQSNVFIYLVYVWQSLSKPTNKEKIWFEHL